MELGSGKSEIWRMGVKERKEREGKKLEIIDKESGWPTAPFDGQIEFINYY